MSEHQHHYSHHYHHHHHKKDWASEYKYKSLMSLQRQKTISKWLFRILCVIAALMVIAVFVVYRME